MFKAYKGADGFDSDPEFKRLRISPVLFGIIGPVWSSNSAPGGDTSAVVLTAFACSEDGSRAPLAGFHAHVWKPAQPIERVAVIARLAGRVGKRAA
jgi:hypothetical protein